MFKQIQTVPYDFHINIQYETNPKNILNKNLLIMCAPIEKHHLHHQRGCLFEFLSDSESGLGAVRSEATSTVHISCTTTLSDSTYSTYFVMGILATPPDHVPPLQK